MSSRLFQEMREKRGLVYSIHSFAHGYRDGGLFGIYAGTGEEEAAELVPVLCDEAIGSTTGFTPVELARAKAQMKAGLLMSLESTSARCEQLAQHLLIHGTPFDPADIVRRIEAVDDAAIGARRRALAQRRRRPSRRSGRSAGSRISTGCGRGSRPERRADERWRRSARRFRACSWLAPSRSGWSASGSFCARPSAAIMRSGPACAPARAIS